MTTRKALRSSVDEQSQHVVAHNKRRQNEQRRDGFSQSSAPGGFEMKKATNTIGMAIVAILTIVCHQYLTPNN